MAADLRSTYRVQLHAGFGFDAAAAITGYLSDLGVSHIYCSPYLQAAPDSAHGYDVVDHARVNEELGGEAGHDRFLAALKRHGMGQVLDIVPNHMAIGGRDNAWWWDVLENGPSSRYASYFDVEWDAPEARRLNTVLLPVLGDHYGRVLEAGELRLERQTGRFQIRYHDQAFPVSPKSLDTLIAAAAVDAGSDELAFIGDALGGLPPAAATDRESVHRRHRDKEVLAVRLDRLCHEQPPLAAAIDAAVKRVNAGPDALDGLLGRQNYRLAFWRTASLDLGYRRFFDINTLVGLRVEDAHVFSDTHQLVLKWVRDAALDGLRVDHPDGLYDPEQYFHRLRDAAPAAWIVAEKILERGERLPKTWGVDGTTGYDFLDRLGGLFVDARGEAPLTQLYAEFTGEPAEYRAVMLQKKEQALRDVLGSDLNRLVALATRVFERNRRHRDYTRQQIEEALRAVVTAFPVYRSYVRPSSGQVSEDDARHINEAVEAAIAATPGLDEDLFNFLRDVLLLRIGGPAEDELAARFQQVTGPAMAKGVEDTAFYCYNRLVALNEVGGDPGYFGTTPEEFHAACSEAQERWPRAMLATSTHDTKRSEDVRARISLLSEIPDQWSETVRRWSAMNSRHRRDGLPDRNVEYLLYQTLTGAWPISVDRAAAYMEKATREAKQHTSWTEPAPEYDAAIRAFVEGVLADEEFTADLQGFVDPLVLPGRITSLSQTIIKLTAPGVPDVYQGTELWDLSLVDPDNRRPVDFDLRGRLLAGLAGAVPDTVAEAVLECMEEGLPKLWLIRQALGLRRRRPDLFGPQGGYEPLWAQGRRAAHAMAFVRGGEAITIAPRLVIGLGGDWQDTTLDLPGPGWRNELTGEHVEGGRQHAGDLLRRFPVALLARN